jgi:ATP-dependent helicase/nuclease subunit A|tara:strand:- start:102089 stop:105430 length:3342 start_codon:yes stop_codon:yes gene_type:complete
MSKALLPLTSSQAEAARPDVHAWVSASAGTGKTQVLSARVLRLLVGGADPAGIMALTFTKAAAAEMQTRILDVLARWVRAEDEEIAADLAAIGAPRDEETLLRARTLFAHALEVRGGFKVQTLHSFAAALLAAFPVEAGVTPGFATLDDRSGAQLRRQVLEEAVTDAAADGDDAFLADLAALAVQHGDARTEEIVGSLLRERRALLDLRSPEAALAAVRAALGLPRTGTAEDIMRQAMDADAGLEDAVAAFAASLNAWGRKTGLERLDKVSLFQLAAPAERVAALEHLCSALFTSGGTGPPYKANSALNGADDALVARIEPLRACRWALDLADVAALHLRVGQNVAARYQAAKERQGALDFADLIDEAARLLSDLSSAWVLYKLDQRIEHVLVDEGQDTNAAQWRIVDALTEEFFAGIGADAEVESRPRTKFAVGDFKQAIFGFQGSEPDEFAGARERTAAAANAAGHRFIDVDLDMSFRSGKAVLAVVDQVLKQLTPAALGIQRPDFPRHEPHRADAAGAVTLWPRLMDEDGNVPEAYRERPERELARRIADQIDGWLRDGRFVPSRGRAVEAQDIMILVRSRGDLVPELVAALHAAGVDVAGADRLRLTSPIVVQDCLALVRFALQPNDELALGELLVSPFLGWSQDELYALAYRRGPRVPLWSALRDAADEKSRAATAWLSQILDMADFMTPYDMLETMLSGPLGGRAKLLSRLGEEARDPLEELLSQALQFERTAAPSLQGFLDWIAAADDIDIKRDPDAPSNAVRIMTVHGAKGLQAPVVIMADAAKARAGTHRISHLMAGDPRLPIHGFSKGTLPEILQAEYDRREREEREESLRLLYVAMTRAEDYLYAGGLPPGRGGDVTWYDIMKNALADLPTEEPVSELWGGQELRHVCGVEAATERRADSVRSAVPLPDWVRQAAPPEARPPRPLSPSAPEDESNLPPPGPQLELAALRGRLMHSLFEKLPALPEAERESAAKRWLASRVAGTTLDADVLAREVVAVMRDPANSDLFGPDALAEAPISAVVGEDVIAGTIDVLLVDETRVRIVDFKTDRNAPEGEAEVPDRHRRQMARYAAALERIFPGRSVEAGLLYTAGPRVIWLPNRSG